MLFGQLDGTGFDVLEPLGKPEEFASLAAYPATAPYATGQAHIIDGGWTASDSS
jgi:NAD(P)-dependent dehydrogenase (short-subunit alcohol dehydrogenase family)